MPNNVYRFRRIKWGAPERLRAMPPSTGRRAPGRNGFAIVAGVVVIGAVLSFLF